MNSIVYVILFATLVMSFTSFVSAEVSVEPIRHPRRNPSESECTETCANSFTGGDKSRIEKVEILRDFYCNCHIKFA
uniref:SLPTX15 n=1 Tax=Hemiscolopendra marginata TaxID=943146 RepID=A0A646QDX6_9MYRI